MLLCKLKILAVVSVANICKVFNKFKCKAFKIAKEVLHDHKQKL